MSFWIYILLIVVAVTMFVIGFTAGYHQGNDDMEEGYRLIMKSEYDEMKKITKEAKNAINENTDIFRGIMDRMKEGDDNVGGD